MRLEIVQFIARVRVRYYVVTDFSIKRPKSVITDNV